MSKPDAAQTLASSDPAAHQQAKHDAELPAQQACVYCDVPYPKPVSYHHSTEECRANEAAGCAEKHSEGPTPRTDAEWKLACDRGGPLGLAMRDWARKLERESAEHRISWQADVDELAAARRVADELRAAQSASGAHWVGAAAEAHRGFVVALEDPSVFPDGGAHLLWMIDQIKAGGMSDTKACRWLGFIQGVLCARGAAMLDELKEINRAASAALSSGSERKGQ